MVWSYLIYKQFKKDRNASILKINAFNSIISYNMSYVWRLYKEGVYGCGILGAAVGFAEGYTIGKNDIKYGGNTFKYITINKHVYTGLCGIQGAIGFGGCTAILGAAAPILLPTTLAFVSYQYYNASNQTLKN